ncbi:hypothetical protein [Hyphococcus sp.]|uniref:hypothetical protein n=1 Tax=Hyphococcus sp. TaxID=2038636 RepID=UPI003D1355D0
MTQKQYLMVSRIGKKSLHDRWLCPAAERAYDVALSSYDETVPEAGGEGVFFEYRPGRKVEGYDGFLRDRRSLWTGYKYICFFDEDLETDADNLNRMFDLCASHDLKIAQPALTHDSYFTYGALLQQPEWSLRYVNFVEMMCPVFRADILGRAAPLYSLGYESGIDLIWCNLVAEGPNDFAVLDGAPVRHTEPVGGNKSANGFKNGRIYEDDIYDILERFNLPWLSCVPYEAQALNDKTTQSKLRFLAAAFNTLPAAAKRESSLQRLRAILVHLRHIAIRPARNIKVEWPATLKTRNSPESIGNALAEG